MLSTIGSELSTWGEPAGSAGVVRRRSWFLDLPFIDMSDCDPEFHRRIK